MNLPENWDKLTPDAKMEARFAAWLSLEGHSFASPEAAQTYQRRVQRVIDVIQLKKPDRVPFFTKFGGFIADYAGVTHKDLMYDFDKSVEAIRKVHTDFNPPYQDTGYFLPGEALDMLGYTVYRWPGQELEPTAPFQAVEAEYMRADEYDDLIANPEGYYLRTYMPRAFANLTGFEKLPGLFASQEIPGVGPMVAAAGTDIVREALQVFLEAGRAAKQWNDVRKQVIAELISSLGMPFERGAFSKAPFDILGDTFRGTRGIMLDMYRQPDKVVAACECLVSIAVQMGIEGAKATGVPIVFMPLHKGADGFMSGEGFKEFYWASLKKVIEGLIAEGLVPYLFVEGSFNRNKRLDVISNSGLPAGKTYWLFDRTDMELVRDRFAGWACFGGNVPASLFYTTSAQEMDDYIRELIESVGSDGGYFLSPGAVLDNVRPENMHAYVNAARKYGAY
ncbi:MAG: uroporphyrinogen decarboxylase family protein [Candidatus Promineifilaceae bacterium]|nr:uroporphyrinogen decarboxylase family protein [Candidatus Promineifilaceae bacterium]